MISCVPNVAPVSKAPCRTLAAKIGLGGASASQAMGTSKQYRHRRVLRHAGGSASGLPAVRHAGSAERNGLVQSGLSNALGRGHTASIEAYHRLLNQLLNTPTIALSTARDAQPGQCEEQDTSGCLDAIRNGHTGSRPGVFRHAG